MNCPVLPNARLARATAASRTLTIQASGQHELFERVSENREGNRPPDSETLYGVRHVFFSKHQHKEGPGNGPTGVNIDKIPGWDRPISEVNYVVFGRWNCCPKPKDGKSCKMGFLSGRIRT